MEQTSRHTRVFDGEKDVMVMTDFNRTIGWETLVTPIDRNGEPVWYKEILCDKENSAEEAEYRHEEILKYIENGYRAEEIPPLGAEIETVKNTLFMENSPISGKVLTNDNVLLKENGDVRLIACMDTCAYEDHYDEYRVLCFEKQRDNTWRRGYVFENDNAVPLKAMVKAWKENNFEQKKEEVIKSRQALGKGELFCSDKPLNFIRSMNKEMGGVTTTEIDSFISDPDVPGCFYKFSRTYKDGYLDSEEKDYVAANFDDFLEISKQNDYWMGKSIEKGCPERYLVNKDAMMSEKELRTVLRDKPSCLANNWSFTYSQIDENTNSYTWVRPAFSPEERTADPEKRQDFEYINITKRENSSEFALSSGKLQGIGYREDTPVIDYRQSSRVAKGVARVVSDKTGQIVSAFEPLERKDKVFVESKRGELCAYLKEQGVELIGKGCRYSDMYKLLGDSLSPVEYHKDAVPEKEEKAKILKNLKKGDEITFVSTLGNDMPVRYNAVCTGIKNEKGETEFKFFDLIGRDGKTCATANKSPIRTSSRCSDAIVGNSSIRNLKIVPGKFTARETDDLCKFHKQIDYDNAWSRTEFWDRDKEKYLKYLVNQNAAEVDEKFTGAKENDRMTDLKKASLVLKRVMTEAYYAGSWGRQVGVCCLGMAEQLNKSRDSYLKQAVEWTKKKAEMMHLHTPEMKNMSSKEVDMTLQTLAKSLAEKYPTIDKTRKVRVNYREREGSAKGLQR